MLITNNYCDIRVSEIKGNYRIRFSIHYFRVEFVVLYIILLVLVEIRKLLLVTDFSPLFCRNNFFGKLKQFLLENHLVCILFTVYYLNVGWYDYVVLAKIISYYFYYCSHKNFKLRIKVRHFAYHPNTIYTVRSYHLS